MCLPIWIEMAFSMQDRTQVWPGISLTNSIIATPSIQKPTSVKDGPNTSRFCKSFPGLLVIIRMLSLCGRNSPDETFVVNLLFHFALFCSVPAFVSREGVMG